MKAPLKAPLKAWLALAPIAAVVLLAAGCADDGQDPATPDPTTRSTPGDPSVTWEPAVPTAAVDEADVRATYDVVLDDVSAPIDRESPDLTWSASTVRTETFDGTCAVTLERTADGPVPPPGDDTLDLGGIQAGLSAHGFGRLTMADDPGGALRHLAQDGADALFELRSKEVATVAVRVPTTADSCAG